MDDLRKFGPRPADSPSGECPACREPFTAGDYTTLIPLGPGADAESQERARAGRIYSAVAAEVHWTCATGEACDGR